MKPDWAQGPEWDGWKVMPDNSVMKMEPDAECYVHPHGTIEIFNQRSGRKVMFKCKSPELARKAAEALLEAME